MSEFSFLMRRADTLRRAESDPIRAEWWVGYKRGLRRAHRGEQFGSAAEHQLFLAASGSADPMRAALGRGYHAGLTLESREPETDTLAHCERCERYVVPRLDHGDLLCGRCGLVLALDERPDR